MSRWTKSLQDASFAGLIYRPVHALPMLIGFSRLNYWQPTDADRFSGISQRTDGLRYHCAQSLKSPDGYSVTVADVLRISLRVFVFVLAKESCLLHQSVALDEKPARCFIRRPDL